MKYSKEEVINLIKSMPDDTRFDTIKRIDIKNGKATEYTGLISSYGAKPIDSQRLHESRK